MAARKTQSNRRTVRTPKKRAEFVAALRGGQSVSDACQAAGIARQRVYEWREDDSDFAAEWNVALDEGTDALEDEAKRRAVDGVDEPVFYQGKEIAKVKKYSDTLLMFLLKGRRPDKFKDRIAHGGDDNAPPIKHEHSALAVISSRLAGIAARRRASSDATEPDADPA